MHTEHINHDPAITFFQTGHQLPGRPSMGSWLSYGLGSVNENLPGFVVLISKDRIDQPLYSRLWGNGFLPAHYQAVTMSAQQPLRNLSRPSTITAAEDQDTRDFLRLANGRHASLHTGEDGLTARMAAYELAARMQLAAPEVSDLAREPASIHRLYGTSDPNPLKAAYARN